MHLCTYAPSKLERLKHTWNPDLYNTQSLGTFVSDDQNSSVAKWEHVGTHMTHPHCRNQVNSSSKIVRIRKSSFHIIVMCFSPPAR